MALEAEAIAKLSLGDPAGSLEALISMHKSVINTLQLAKATQGRVSEEFPSAAHQFQHITGCKRSEALYYLNHVPNNDMRAAVIAWHRQVLKDYLAKYQQIPAQEQQQLPPSFKEHEMKEQAELMRSKARKAAAAADSYEMQDMAQNYLRTNFCSICKVEREVANKYMEATDYNIIAAVEEYIARHMLHPAQTQDPDSGLAQHKVLLTRRHSTAGSEQCFCSCHTASSSSSSAHSVAAVPTGRQSPTGNSNATAAGPLGGGSFWANPLTVTTGEKSSSSAQQHLQQPQQQQQQQHQPYPKVAGAAALYSRSGASSTAAQAGSGGFTVAGPPVAQGDSSFGLGNLRSRFGGQK